MARPTWQWTLVIATCLLGLPSCGAPPATPAPEAKTVEVAEELPTPVPADAATAVPKPAAASSESNSTTTPVAPQPPMNDTMPGIPLIARETLFGNPQRAAARISPDGSKLSFLAPVNNVLNVWVGPISDPSAAKAVTNDTKRGIRGYFWSYTSKHLLYTQDQDGDENWHVYSVNLESGETKDLTPIEEVNAQIEGVSEKFPNEVLIGLNDRNKELHDVYRVNIETGERTLLQENPGLAGFVIDDDYRVRFGMQYSPQGKKLLKPNDAQGWDDYLVIPMQDAMTSSPAGFDKTGNILYFIESRDRDTGALTAIDIPTGAQTVVAEDPRADLSGVISHPTEKTIEAVAFTYAREEWKILDPSVQPDFDYLKSVHEGEFQITSRTLDDQHWTVAYLTDNGPVLYYYYDRAAKKANYLFANRDDLKGLPLVHMHDVVIKARDGLDLVSYLTLPPGSDEDGDGRPSKPVPMILDVHGGPWARDEWGFNPDAQLWANRGYAVLNVNFRGSTGFGKKFINASAKEWAAKMHDDLLDAVDWAKTEKIADPDKIAIMGGSYGGYATLVGLTFTPDVFNCGVDIVGPSNLKTLLASVPEYWMPMMPIMHELMGDPESEAGQKLLEERSPLNFVEKIAKPLLIAQGANDPRVKQAEADQIVAAMKSKQIPVTYVLYPDEGHGFARPENRMSFYAVAEAFLAEHLGGRYEPIGKAFDGATITVPDGASDVPGLEAALKAK
ncbi:MAG: S9 family peptidase [Planctomycetia bacterium]|nr:S9 family peptidase [Planctomycetia bacterium]